MKKRWLLITKLTNWKIEIIIWLLLGIYIKLIETMPIDYQQGEIYKIIYIHVPLAWLTLQSYVFLTILSILYIIRKEPMYRILIKSMNIITWIVGFLTLITGSLWGKNTWGSYWVFDVRLTSVLVLVIIISINLIIIFINQPSYHIQHLWKIKISSNFINLNILTPTTSILHESPLPIKTNELNVKQVTHYVNNPFKNIKNIKNIQNIYEQSPHQQSPHQQSPHQQSPHQLSQVSTQPLGLFPVILTPERNQEIKVNTSNVLTEGKLIENTSLSKGITKREWKVEVELLIKKLKIEIQEFLNNEKLHENNVNSFKLISLITIFGSINVPIIKYSVDWWSSLHQKNTFSFTKTSIDFYTAIPLFLGVLLLSLIFILFLIQDWLNKRKLFLLNRS